MIAIRFLLAALVAQVTAFGDPSDAVKPVHYEEEMDFQKNGWDVCGQPTGIDDRKEDNLAYAVAHGRSIAVLGFSVTALSREISADAAKVLAPLARGNSISADAIHDLIRDRRFELENQTLAYVQKLEKTLILTADLIKNVGPIFDWIPTYSRFVVQIEKEGSPGPTPSSFKYWGDSKPFDVARMEVFRRVCGLGTITQEELKRLEYFVDRRNDWSRPVGSGGILFFNSQIPDLGLNSVRPPPLVALSPALQSTLDARKSQRTSEQSVRKAAGQQWCQSEDFKFVEDEYEYTEEHMNEMEERVIALAYSEQVQLERFDGEFQKHVSHVQNFSQQLTTKDFAALNLLTRDFVNKPETLEVWRAALANSQISLSPRIEQIRQQWLSLIDSTLALDDVYGKATWTVKHFLKIALASAFDGVHATWLADIENLRSELQVFLNQIQFDESRIRRELAHPFQAKYYVDRDLAYSMALNELMNGIHPPPNLCNYDFLFQNREKLKKLSWDYFYYLFPKK